MKPGFTVVATALSGLTVSILAGCSDVKLVRQYSGHLDRPEQVVVHDLAATSSDVQLDGSPTTELARQMQDTSRSNAAVQLGRAVAKATTKELIAQLQAMGMPAVPASAARAEAKHVLNIRGYFVTIDEGNRLERVTIGLGAGRSKVSAVVQAYAETDKGRVLALEFDAEDKSLLTPGMAETMGVGALSGHLAASAVVGGAGQVASEAFVQNVNADAKHMADSLAKRMKSFFVNKGWISD